MSGKTVITFIFFLSIFFLYVTYRAMAGHGHEGLLLLAEWADAGAGDSAAGPAGRPVAAQRRDRGGAGRSCTGLKAGGGLL